MQLRSALLGIAAVASAAGCGLSSQFVGAGAVDAGGLCGDGVVQVGEACDDGNPVPDDGCTNDCTLAGCGNGIIEPNEVCDDGNTVDDDGCSNACLPLACGDGTLQVGEACDDGNNAPLDGCSSTCTIELGIDSTLPGLTCLDVRMSGVSVTGLYWIDPSGGSTGDAFQAWCDMGTDGGGWTLVFHFFDHTGFTENAFVTALGTDQFTDVSWRYVAAGSSYVAGDPTPLEPMTTQGALGISLFAGTWTDVRMSCSTLSATALEEHWAQVDGYTTANGNDGLLGAAANGTSYAVDSMTNSLAATTVWHDNETDGVNGAHYLCDQLSMGANGTAQFAFCYTDFLNNPNSLEQGDSITAISFGSYGAGEVLIPGWLGECGDMNDQALVGAGTYSIYIR